MSGASYEDGRSYRGKRFVLVLFLSFVMISVVCGFGTWGLGQAMRPMLEQRDKEAAEKAAIERMQRREGDANVR